MKKTIAAAAVLAALALTGCVGQPIEITPAAPTAPAVSPSRAAEIKVERAQAIEGQEWADGLMARYEALEHYYPAEKLAGSPNRKIVNWGAPAVGHLEIGISGTKWQENEDLEFFANELLQDLGDSSVRSVTVATMDGEASSMATANGISG